MILHLVHFQICKTISQCPSQFNVLGHFFFQAAFLELMNLSNLMNGYQYIDVLILLDGWKVPTDNYYW